MNCIAKILMGVIAERLNNWVCQNNILTEYQAGFRKKYSTMDNLYNLTAIIQLKFSEKKKVYAFFVDFKAAFDKVVRKSLMFKLSSIAVSTKMVQFIRKVYQSTTCTIWNGEELSDKFETYSGVKQGCLLSPLLFSIYLNDLHDHLEGGLNIDGMNIRVLLYADDIVLIAEDVKVLQLMINNLESYCDYWDLEVNRAKSKIMVFRNGGRIAQNEKWSYKGSEIEIVPEYCYLGTILTPKCVFKKHVEARNISAKNCINATWNSLLVKNDISINTKIQLFNAVCRSVQSYGCQIWGHSYFEEVDKFQRFFLKRILNLPTFTPTYALMLEAGIEDGHIYTLLMHMRYIRKTIYEYTDRRLPHTLTAMVLQKNISWANRLNNLGREFGIQWVFNMTEAQWDQNQMLLVEGLRMKTEQTRLDRWIQTESFYKNLDPASAFHYFDGGNTCRNIMWMFKTRCDLLKLNGSRFSQRNSKLCTLCNRKEFENLLHFMGKCPVLNGFRHKFFGKIAISQEELVRILNGEVTCQNVVNYVIDALAYRKILITEFNG